MVYVEDTKFAIEEARDIVMNNMIVASRPKDSHDILGVFRLAVETPFRHSPPVAGEDFLAGLEDWHREMLRMRPEVNPGVIKTLVNYAGTTQFVNPSHVRSAWRNSEDISRKEEPRNMDVSGIPEDQPRLSTPLWNGWGQSRAIFIDVLPVADQRSAAQSTLKPPCSSFAYPSCA